MLEQLPLVDVTVLGLVGGAPGGETPRVADSSAAGAGRGSGLASVVMDILALLPLAKTSADDNLLHQIAAAHSRSCPRNTIFAIQASRLPWFAKDTAAADDTK